MGTILAQTIVNNVATTLLDETNVRWPDPELLSYLNDGQRELVAIKPDANTVTASLNLVPGTKQSISGVQFIKAVRNVGGPAITPASMETMDRLRPTWHTDPASTEVKHYLFDPRDPRTFYVTPPQPALAGSIDVVYAATPADVAIGSPISIDDIYATALYYYILARAHSKETPGADAGKASGYYNLFMSVLGQKAGGENRLFERAPRGQKTAQLE